ncbi:hypothetical protein A2721_00295 [Candidatus Gottesmanbacteria bacterium RIFCSPHIGHO2_01_FULL_47_48]|uniref:Addiction module toxin, HicA family n=1 Tax=Candidatus Gottesmanbacteria bacterium RIFCSPHIGHO2_01_FULL_47_48 TaxID=1798381 RepID=A0A1F6A133_9BACT|nr:MAG: hypothetical protein A2721_00295 [Candidatus Gottesmanbacteria bacterium RIFCSPHIGHO2_01_FULL_47_48]
MPKIPQIKPRDVEKVLLKEGFVDRTTKSSHVVFVHKDGRRTVVPVHNKPVSTGTLRAILRQAKISVEDFLEEV